MKGVSVIVSTYSKDRLNYLLECVESIEKQSLRSDDIILVLDEDSLAGFYESKLPTNVKIVISGKRGLSNARNAGAKSAKGEILAFIDDDAVADRNWLENLVRNYEDPNVVGVGGLIKPLWANGAPMWFPEELNWVVGCSYKGLPEHRASVRNPIGCNMSFRKSVFDEVGYFRSDVGRFGKKLLAGEESEFSVKILGKVSGSKIVYEPSAVVYHRVDRNRVTLKYLCRRSFYEGVSKALLANSKQFSSRVLSTEDEYLKYLLTVAIPFRLRRIYKFESVGQLLALVFSMFSVFAGFSLARLGTIR